ncbi:extracellular solute-binding protein [Paracoccus pantotrophus]|uniref:Extracellular solute-binding protein n=1 Tax=Paracoccus pantotrophus TaxID=82367 RepID=A0A7H9BPQ4_PARPN|nr:extracellular solute-binding protein [Paracoccus pantotrophus]QLH13076.1 extracellular solute-binding protein [Paracoccus pantotrophus]
MTKTTPDQLLRTTKTVLASAALFFVGTVAQADGIRVTNMGGSFGEAKTLTAWEPISQKLNITIEPDTYSGLIDVRTQAKSGSSPWDLGELTVDECAIASKEGLLEPLNLTTDQLDGYPEEAYRGDYVLTSTASYVPVWQNNLPGLSSWADFWDVQRFPGTRALRDNPMENLPAALIADGVPLDQIYPLDVDRAFRKLEEIKPHITTWWASGAQSIQLLASGDIDYAGGWTTRVGALIEEGGYVSYTLNNGILIPNCAFIPKGSKNVDIARQVLVESLSVEIIKELPKHINSSPVNQNVFKPGVLPDEVVATQAASPDNLKLQVMTDGEWWAENGVEVMERWQEFKSR